MMEDVRGKMARGAIWMVLFKFVDRSIGLTSTMILARILTPENFGIVGMAMSFVALLELFGAFGFDTALIQRQDATPVHYNTAWTFNVIIGTSIAILMVASAGTMATYYRQPEVAAVVRTLALGCFLQGFANIGTVAFRKELNFQKEFNFLLSKRLITFPVTIGLAIWLQSYWALVIGVVSGRMLELWISYRVHPYRPRLTLAAAPDLLHFSKWLFLLNIMGFFKERAHDFILGRSVGARGLGLFSQAYEWSSLPGTELVAPINRAVFPAYARIAADVNALRREYLSVMAMIVLLAIPAVAGMAAVAKLVIPVALGPAWLDAVPILELLAYFGITQVMQSNAYSLFLATGRAKIFAWIQGAHVVVLLTLLITLVRWNGMVGAAQAYLVTALIMLPVTFAVVLRTLDLPVRAVLAIVWRPLLAAATMFLVVKLAIHGVASTAPLHTLVLALLSAVGLGVLTYGAAVALLWRLSGRPAGAEDAALDKIVSMLKKVGLVRR